MDALPLDQLMDAIPSAATVRELLNGIEQLEAYRDTYEFLIDRLKQAIATAEAVNPDYAAAVLTELEVRHQEIVDAIDDSKNFRLGRVEAAEGKRAKEAAEDKARRTARARKVVAQAKEKAGKAPSPPEKPASPSSDDSEDETDD